MKGRRAAAGAALALALVAPGARADVRLGVLPLLGVEGISNDGWAAFAVRVENTEKGPIKGRLVGNSDGGKRPSSTEVPVAVLPGASVVVRLPLRLEHGWSIKLELLDEGGKSLASEVVFARGRREPLLIDLHATPRLGAQLKGAQIPVSHDLGRGRGELPLTVGSGVYDAASGDPILPEHAAEWGVATAVLAPSDLLSRLGGAEQQALADHVLAGGTLAVVVKRPEDLRQGLLAAMLGGAAQEAGAARHLRRFPSAALAGAPVKGGGGDDAPSGMVLPRREVADALLSYSGGNLRPSDYGASAPYGLGEVHLLAFDPSKAPEVDDPWVQSRVADLVRHAWNRRPFLIAPQGGIFGEDKTSTQALRGLLDPNENSRWSILVAVALLVLYAAAAGPINFFLATRAGKPLRALLLLPALSAMTFVAVVGLAVASKGFRGEARRASLTEAAGGVPRGTIRRYRGFFTPVAQQVSVGASSDQALPSLIDEGTSRPALRVDRGGVELQGVGVMPWQTTVIREDDLARLGEGVSLTATPEGDVRVTNRLGRDLRGALVQVPGRGLYYLATIKDGAAALALAGQELSRGNPATSTVGHGVGAGVVHPLHRAFFEAAVDRDTPGLGAAWQAFEELSSAQHVDWWPEGQPVLLAQLDGGEGVTEDQGLRVSRDRALLRVVGYGGKP